MATDKNQKKTKNAKEKIDHMEEVSREVIKMLLEMVNAA